MIFYSKTYINTLCKECTKTLFCLKTFFFSLFMISTYTIINQGFILSQLNKGVLEGNREWKGYIVYINIYINIQIE